MKTHLSEIEIRQRFYAQLSEKDQRLFAAQESRRRGWVGISSVAQDYGIARSTICRGVRDLESSTMLPVGRVRKQGGGRKKRLDKEPALDRVFLEILAPDIAGSPQSDARWTHLSKPAIQKRFQERGHCLGVKIIEQLLRGHGFGKRKHRKSVSMGDNAGRDAQFQRIATLRTEYAAKGAPVVSMDTKKRACR